MIGIISPVMTEKSVLSLSDGLYVFNVARNATKNSIADELRKLYGVEVVSVRIVNLPAKKVNFKRREGVRSKRRKAYVQLAPKQHIPGIELPKEEKETKKKGKD